MRPCLFLTILAAALAAPAADAAVSVIGSSAARSCYEAALRNRPGAGSVRHCDEALADRGLSGRDRVATFVNRGILHVLAGDFAAGIADYDAAIALDDSEPEAYLNKGLALLRRDRTSAEAVRLLTMAIERGTREPALAYYGRGVANEFNGDIEAAYFDLRRAAELAPGWDAPARDLERFRVVGGSGTG